MPLPPYKSILPVTTVRIIIMTLQEDLVYALSLVIQTLCQGLNTIGTCALSSSESGF